MSDATATGDDFRGRLSRLRSPTEHKVAYFLLEAGPRAAAMSAGEIAEAGGTSDATVVRTAKSLGYDGMRQLRRALSDRKAEPDLTSRLEATISDFRTDKDIVGATVERHLRALDTLLSQVTPELFDSAVNMLTSARRTWWCGTGPSAYIAGYASFLTRRLGRASGVLTH